MRLEIDSEKVLSLAERCPQWKEGLTELFPEAFEKEIPAIVGGTYSLGNCNDTYIMVYSPESLRVFFTDPRNGRHWGSSENSPETLIKANASYINGYLGKVADISTEKK